MKVEIVAFIYLYVCKPIENWDPPKLVDSTHLVFPCSSKVFLWNNRNGLELDKYTLIDSPHICAVLLVGSCHSVVHHIDKWQACGWWVRFLLKSCMLDHSHMIWLIYMAHIAGPCHVDMTAKAIVDINDWCWVHAFDVKVEASCWMWHHRHDECGVEFG